VTVRYCEQLDANMSPGPELDPMLLLIAGKAYGLSDSPLVRQTVVKVNSGTCPILATATPSQPRAISLTAVVQTSTLINAPIITLKPLFGGREDTFPINLVESNKFSALSQADKVMLLKQTAQGAEFLLYGNRLGDDMQVDPPVSLEKIADKTAEEDTNDSIRYVTLSEQQLKQYKFLVLTRKGEAPEAVAIPAVTIPPATPDTPVVTGTILRGDDTASVTGAGLSGLRRVTFGKSAILFVVAKDGKSATLLNLRKAGVTTNARLQSLNFYFAPKPVKVTVDVYTQKDQTIPR
jgi:hypothetical protein